MKVIEETAKKVEDAINQGLAKLGATLDEVNVEVLESGGLFRKAKVRLTLDRADETPAQEKANAQKPEITEKVEKVEKTEKAEKADAAKKSDSELGSVNSEKAEKPQKPEKVEKANKPVKKEQPAKSENVAAPKNTEQPKTAEPRKRTEEDKAAAAHALEFVKEMIAKMGFEGVEVKSAPDSEMIEVTAPAGDDSLIIGRHGETLSALSYLAETCARAEKHHINITVDCNGYRERRAASLTSLAKRRADECVNKRRKIKLEPMERIDRRTVHNALTGDERVCTASEGKEPYRYVVIMPKKNG